MTELFSAVTRQPRGNTMSQHRANSATVCCAGGKGRQQGRDTAPVPSANEHRGEKQQQPQASGETDSYRVRKSLGSLGSCTLERSAAPPELRPTLLWSLSTVGTKARSHPKQTNQGVCKWPPKTSVLLHFDIKVNAFPVMPTLHRLVA